MNILLFNTHNPLKTSGGIPLDLLIELKKKGHHVRLLVNSYDSSYPEEVISMKSWHKDILERKITNKIKYYFLNKFSKIIKKYNFQDINEKKYYYSTNQLLKRLEFKPDVIILFFVSNFLNAKNIYELYQKTKSPIYWLLYDMAPMTGGCHYAWDCIGYQSNCSNCPGLISTNQKYLTSNNLKYKQKYFSKTDLRIVAGSEWTYRQAKNSTLFKDHIINKNLIAFNKEIFKPISKNLIRQKIGIPIDRKVVFFGAYSLNDERKGIKYLLEALEIIYDKLKNNKTLSDNIFLLIAGNNFNSIKNQLLFDFHNMGMLDNNYGIASAYQAADLFVSPSIEDSGPTMINQSIMCGTPVVSFEMGVAIDLVINDKTGYIAKIKDSNDLANGILNILNKNHEEQLIMQHNCRNLALDLFQSDVVTNNWLNIINNDR